MSPVPLVVGCVADQPPQLLEQAWRLLVSWRANAGPYREAPFVLCVAGGIPPAFASCVAPYAPQLHAVAPLTPRHPPSNKLQWFARARQIAAERYVLLDCDTWVCQEPSGLFGAEQLRAKLADIATVTDAVFDQVFVAAGVPKPPAHYRLTLRGEASIAYFNAGVLSFSRAALDHVVPRWLHWNAWLEQRLDLLGPCQGFLEQASLALTVAELELPVGQLDESHNFPAHFKDELLPSLENIDPVILHYHRETTADGRLAPSPFPAVNRRIDLANATLFSAWRDLALSLAQAAADTAGADRSTKADATPENAGWQRFKWLRWPVRQGGSK